MKKKSKKQTLTVQDAADQLKLSTKTVQRLCREDKIIATKIDLNWVLDKDSFDQFKTNHLKNGHKVYTFCKLDIIRTGEDLLDGEEIDPFVPKIESLGAMSGAVGKSFKLKLQHSADSVQIRMLYDITDCTPVDRIFMQEQLMKYGLVTLMNLEVLTEDIITYHQYEFLFGEIVFHLDSEHPRDAKIMVLEELSDMIKIQFNLDEKKTKQEIDGMITMPGPKESIQ